MSANLEDVAKILVHQQFYDEKESVIYGRTKEVKIHIPNVGCIIDAFLREIARPLPLLQIGEYSAYLAVLAQVLTFDEKHVGDKFQQALGNVDPADLTDTIAATFLIGEVLTGIREAEYLGVEDEVKHFAQDKFHLPDAVIHERLSFLHSTNDPTVSLLYSLSMLRMLAVAFGSCESGKNIEELMYQHVRILVDKVGVKPPKSSVSLAPATLF